MIKELNISVVLITKENSLLSKLDIEKYNKQYSNLIVIRNNDFHDRYFIIDNDKVYHCGTSLNHAGSKTFSINYLEDKQLKDSFIKIIKTIINKKEK